MGQRTQMNGGCLCGAVRFTANPNSNDFTACHCTICRKWSAGPYLTIHCGDTLEIIDKSCLGVFKSSEWAERGFCKKCGTSLYYKVSNHPFTSISIEAFDDPSNFRFDRQVFIDEKPARYAFADKTNLMTGAEVFAAFAPSNDGGTNV